MPETIEELSKFALIGREKLTSVRAEIRAIDKLKLANDVKEQKLSEAQNIAEIVLDAETKIGELLKEIPKETNNQYTKVESISGDTKQTSKQQTQSDIGISKQQAVRFMKLAENTPIVEQTKAEAREKGEIVTRQAVMDKAKQDEKQRNSVPKKSWERITEFTHCKHTLIRGKIYDFDSRNDVILWIINNQFGRRNISAYDRSLLALRLKPMIVEKAKIQQIRKPKNSVPQISAEQKTIETRKELAKMASVSHDTIAKVEKIEKAAALQRPLCCR